MKLQQYLLTEKIINFFQSDIDERQKYAQQVWQILQDSYRKIGGIHGSGFKSIEDMVENIPMWKLFKRGGEVKVVMMYKDKGGRKRVAIGTDGSPAAKSMLKTMLEDEYKTGRSFGEVSGNSLKFIKRLFGENEFKSIAIPVETVKKVLKGTEIDVVDDYLYRREIGGHWHEKMMLGNPNAPQIRKKI